MVPRNCTFERRWKETNYLNCHYIFFCISHNLNPYQIYHNLEKEKEKILYIENGKIKTNWIN